MSDPAAEIKEELARIAHRISTYRETIRAARGNLDPRTMDPETLLKSWLGIRYLEQRVRSLELEFLELADRLHALPAGDEVEES